MIPHEPVILTQYVLVRLLKSFARRFGLDDGFADALSQIHLQQSPILQQWSLFFRSNCASCRLEPLTCPFLNPTNPLPGQSLPHVRDALAFAIESGRIRTCPAHEPTETP